jgi:hypothetical protein
LPEISNDYRHHHVSVAEADDTGRGTKHVPEHCSDVSGRSCLFRKYYYLSQDGNTLGGIYLWNSRAEAEAMYTESWRTFVRDKYDTDPSVTYFDSPVVVDNLSHEILSDD